MEEEDPGKEIEGIYIEVGRWIWKDGIVIHREEFFKMVEIFHYVEVLRVKKMRTEK